MAAMLRVSRRSREARHAAIPSTPHIAPGEVWIFGIAKGKERLGAIALVGRATPAWMMRTP
jgi:hypothetical protein